MRTLQSHGFFFSKPLCGYKRWGRCLCQKHQSVATMAYPWCSCSHPREICIVLPSKNARRELASDKKSPCYLILHPQCSHRIHFGHHVLASSNDADLGSLG